MSQVLSSQEEPETEELQSLLAVWFKHTPDTATQYQWHTAERKDYTLPQSLALRILKLLMAGSMASSSNGNVYKTVVGECKRVDS
jgi:hypothetical protein